MSCSWEAGKSGFKLRLTHPRTQALNLLALLPPYLSSLSAVLLVPLEAHRGWVVPHIADGHTEVLEGVLGFVHGCWLLS